MRLLTSDLHLTDKPDDEYRWGIFDFLDKQAKKDCEIYILGDVTDFKDNHSSVLVNRIMDNLYRLSKENYVHILCGNHDYKKKEHPFFSFAKYTPNVSFYTEITHCNDILLLPHTRTPGRDWENLSKWCSEQDTKYLFMHESVIGAVASDTYEITSGLPQSYFSENVPEHIKIYSGDIHVPQVCGRVEYVGSPYRVRFGDKFTGRVIKIDDKDYAKSIYFHTMNKHSVSIKKPEDLLELDAKKGDQIKVQLCLSKEAYSQWYNYKKEIQEVCFDMELDLKEVKLKAQKKSLKRRGRRELKRIVNLGKDEIIRKFCSQEKTSDSVLTKGLEILEE